MLLVQLWKLQRRRVARWWPRVVWPACVLFPTFWIHGDFEDAGEVLHHVEVVFEQINRAFSSRIASGLVRTCFDQQCRAFPAAKKDALWSAVSLPSLP